MEGQNDWTDTPPACPLSGIGADDASDGQLARDLVAEGDVRHADSAQRLRLLGAANSLLTYRTFGC